MGSYKNPLICDKENIFNVSKVLQDVVIKSEDYRCSEKFMDENSFVYLDPPFRPLNKTSYFTNYSKINLMMQNKNNFVNFTKEFLKNMYGLF